MNESALWYQTLLKPTWSPPSWLFGPVWTVLYSIIAVTYGYVVWMYIQGKIPFRILLPFLLNLVFNFIFTWLQFGLKNNLLAVIDIALVFVTLVWALVVIFPMVRMVALANIPYLLWVAFATVLQLTITTMNWK